MRFNKTAGWCQPFLLTRRCSEPLQAAIHQRHTGFIVKTENFAGIAQQLDPLLGQQLIAAVAGEKLFAHQLFGRCIC